MENPEMMLAQNQPAFLGALICRFFKIARGIMGMMHQKEKMARVFSSALPKIKPSARETEECFEAAAHLIRKLERVVPQSVEIRLAGSLAKGTNLSKNNEFDIFILFPRHYPHHEMAMLGLHYARRAFAGMRIESRYAEHPYLQVFHGGFHADIVPAYRINDIGQKGSSVDRSQLHTQYVNAKLDAKGKDDVRLLKRFMKNFGIYGAELRVEGFSGYLCELLIAHYGSLAKLMEAASKWDAPAIDMAGGKSAAELRKEFSSPLILVDPTDPKRNVAAVVAETSLSRFVFECRRFLKGPSERFFFSQKKQRSAAEIGGAIRKRGTLCLAVRFPAPKVVPDVLWPQLKKAAQALVRHLESLDFSVFGYYHWSDGNECVVLLELDCWQLPAVKKSPGPGVRFASDVEEFARKHADCYNLHIEHDRMVAVERREETNALGALAKACKNPHGLGIPSHMEGPLAQCRIIDAKRLSGKKYRELLSDYFFMKIA